MARSEKEVGTKIHKLRRILVAGIVILGLAVAGVACYVLFANSVALAVANGLLVGCGATLVTGSCVGIHKLMEGARVSMHKRRAGKALTKIKELDKDVSTKYSSKYRAKILKKYAKAGLALSKIQGATIFGELTTTSGVQNHRGAELVTKIDAYNILMGATTSTRKQKKYSKKIKSLNEDLLKIATKEGVSDKKQRWTRTYDSVVDGVSAVDRRTEIVCLTDYAKRMFQVLTSAPDSTSSTWANIYMRFNQGSNISPCFARIEDATKVEDVKKIFMHDLYEACQTKSEYERALMFPVVIESKQLNAKNAKATKKGDTFVINSFSELEKYVSSGGRTV